MEIRQIVRNKRGLSIGQIARDKRGLSIGDIYPVILVIATVAILLAVVLFVLTSFAEQMTNGSTAQNATKDIVNDFVEFVPWIGIILLVVAAAIVLGVVISSFAGKRGRV